jgi:hypothetical protein
MRLNTRIKECIYTVYMEVRPQNVILYCCVCICNMESSLGNRICVNMFVVFKKTGLRIYQYKIIINNNVKMLKGKISRSYVHQHKSISCEVLYVNSI